MSKMMVVKTTIVHNDNISFLQVPRRLQVRFVQSLPQDAGQMQNSKCGHTSIKDETSKKKSSSNRFEAFL